MVEVILPSRGFPLSEKHFCNGCAGLRRPRIDAYQRANGRVSSWRWRDMGTSSGGLSLHDGGSARQVLGFDADFRAYSIPPEGNDRMAPGGIHGTSYDIHGGDCSRAGGLRSSRSDAGRTRTTRSSSIRRYLLRRCARRWMIRLRRFASTRGNYELRGPVSRPKFMSAGRSTYVTR